MSLPSGLSSYEFQRRLEPSPDVAAYWHYRILRAPDGLPLLAPGGMPEFAPIDITAFFGKPGPIEIEIGCGKGGFLVEYCEKHPDIPFLGIEKEPEIAHWAAQRLAKRRHLPHARMLLGEAYNFFRDHLPANCVSVFHMYFPDPWPKKRHHKYRLLGPVFLEQVRRTAIPGALFRWGTDHPEYNAQAQETFAATPWLEMIEPAAEPTEGIMTNFEKKYRKIGKPIHRCVLRVAKSEGPTLPSLASHSA
jgi:tRNA (guanine-N7-)-methyltransferase